MSLIVALSGAVASGKSTVAAAILAQVGGERVSTRSLIVERKGVPSERGALQAAGDELDEETAFNWIADGVEKVLGRSHANAVIVVDAVRRIEQVERLRSRFPQAVHHVHVAIDPDLLAARHAGRRHDVVEPDDYDDVRRHPTETGVQSLAPLADVSFDPSRLDDVSLAVVALAGRALVRQPLERLVDVIVGGQYGSEGKGNVCSRLAGGYGVLMRVGGPNAGHKVRDPDYDFIHLPSGALHNPSARLLIGAGATLSLEVLLREIRETGAGDRLSVDPQAIVIEPDDVLLEEGALESIGSTKKGVGVATARKILNRGRGPGYGRPVRLARDVAELAPFVRSTWKELERAYADGERVMLEGTQGTDLSIHHGMWPHVTSRETTVSGCMADAGVPPDRIRRVIMVVRTYPIRVGGTSGYMGRETSADEIAERSGGDADAIRRTEVGTVSGKPRRIGEFDLGQVRRSARINGADEIALTFADYVDAGNATARTFAELTARTRTFIGRIEDASGCPVTMVSSGPHPAQMLERRAT